MGRKFRSDFGDNYGYIVGDTTDNVGYYLDDDGSHYTLGANQKTPFNGWIVTGEQDEDKVFLCRYKNSKQDNGILMISGSERFEVAQMSAKNGPGGYTLSGFPNGSWLYQCVNKSGSSKAIFYDGEESKLYMGFMEDGDLNSKTLVGDGIIQEDFSFQFGQFKSDTYTDIGDFVEDNDYYHSENDGPYVLYDEEEGRTQVGCNVDGEGEGITYVDYDDQIAVRQFSKDSLNGPELTVFKDDSEYQYLYYKDGEEYDIRIYVYPPDGTMEVRNYCYKDEELYDCLFIDKDFNVFYHEQFDDEADKGTKKVSFYFNKEDDDSDEEEQEYDDEVEDEVEEDDDEVEEDEDEGKDVLPKLKRKGAKPRSSDDEDDEVSDDDLKSQLRAIFKRKSKK